MKIIAGMHRSGTSLVARLFHEAGADLGDPETFYRGDQWNPDGYFEQPSIHEVNMPLIHGRLGRLSYLFLPTPKMIARRADSVQALIECTSDAFAGKVVKDCRFSLTMEAWMQNGADVSAVVVCMREPGAVGRSLQKRNHVPVSTGLRLWYEHNARLLEAIGTRPTWMIDYDRLFGADSFHDEVAGAFDLFDVTVSAGQLEELRTRLVKSGYRHNNGAGYAYPERVERLWSHMRAQHRDQYAGIG